MKISRQDIQSCIDGNELLHGLTSGGLAVRRPGGTPYPDGLDDAMLETIRDAVDWLKKPLDEGGCIVRQAEGPTASRSYSLKHRFESDRNPRRHIPNGAFILALALAGFQLRRARANSPDARSSARVSHEATVRMAFSPELVGAREQLANPADVRQKLVRAFIQVATGDILAWSPSFWNWVCDRRALDNPRGDFIQDTRRVRDERNGADGWHEACMLRLACAPRSWELGEHDQVGIARELSRQFAASLGSDRSQTNA